MNGYEFDRQVKKECLSPPAYDLPLAYSLQPHHSKSVILAGVDEVGRGALAGPVVVAAVILPDGPEIKGLNDSKVLPPKKREALFSEITKVALAYTVACIDPGLIDQINILAATMKAMRQAVQELTLKPDLVLVDGNQKPLSGRPEKVIIKGDSKSACIMAASIIAKVSRDRMMVRWHEKYPHYGFDEHKGYGSERHLENLEKFGPCPIHRFSFEPVKSTGQKPFSLMFP